MSMKNEHYLEQIKSLEQQLTLLQERYNICQNNYRLRDKQFSLASQENHNLWKTIRSLGLYDIVKNNHISAYTGILALDEYLYETGVVAPVEASCNAVTDDFCVQEGECISGAFDERRGAWEEFNDE